jgi:nitrate/nitrite transporter NarK
MRTGNGNTWLGCAFTLLCLSLGSTVFAFLSGFTFDPDDHSSAYYAAKIPGMIGVMVVSILVPLAAAVASVLTAIARPREAWRTTIAVLILCVALASVWLCLWLGLASVQQTIGFAEHSPM